MIKGNILSTTETTYCQKIVAPINFLARQGVSCKCQLVYKFLFKLFLQQAKRSVFLYEKNTVYKSCVPPVVKELTLWFGHIVPVVQKESLFPLGCVQSHSTYLPVTNLRDKAIGDDMPVDEQPELLQILSTAVLVVEVIGVLPYIDSQQRR